MNIARLFMVSFPSMIYYSNMEAEQQQPTIEDLIMGLPLVERVPVAALHSLLEQREKLDEDQEVELQRSHQKYAEIIKPLLLRASELIQGKDPLPAEIEGIENYLKAGEKIPQLKGKLIDRYWNAALENSQLAQFITETDEAALEYLQDIQIVDETEGVLRFFFKANPYFNETVLNRSFKFTEGRPACVQGDEPTWKAGHWLTHESKKTKNKATGETKAVKGKKIDSFFDIFLNWNINDNPDEMEKCFNIFHDLKIIIRDSLNYFLGVYEFEGEGDSGDDEEDEYEQEDEESEEPGRNKTKK